MLTKNDIIRKAPETALYTEANHAIVAEFAQYILGLSKVHADFIEGTPPQNGSCPTIPFCRAIRAELHQRVIGLDALIRRVEEYEEKLFWK